MRITNTIMHRNSLTNLNKNKVYLDKLNTQQVTGKKITRPSDDPIIAIRALRLRASLSEVTQYHDRNVKDAQGWLAATGDAIENTSKVISQVQSAYTQGANGENTLESRKAILDSLKASRDQIYANADADYADRTIFTGYRTASKVTFQTDEMVRYRDITEGFNASDLKELKYVSGKLDRNDHIVNYDKLAANGIDIDQVENDVVNNSVTRLRLAYEDLDFDANQTTKELVFRDSFVAASSFDSAAGTVEVKDDAGATLYTLNIGRDGKLEAPATGTFQLVSNEDGTYTIDDRTAGTGNVVHLTASGKVMNAYKEDTMAVTVKSIAGGNEDDAYAPGPTEINFIPETGELIIGTDQAEKLAALQDIDGVDTIEFKYDKSDWRKGDLRPEHYFDCRDETDPDQRKWIVYDSHNQEICYDVSANQSMRVNSYASDIFIHAIGRDVDEMIVAIEDANAAEEKVKALEEKLEDTNLSEEDAKTLKKLLDAAKKEQTYTKDKVQKMFESGQTSFKEYVHIATLAGEQVGDRQNRIALVEDRLLDLQTTVKELADDNENVDEISIMTDIKQAELAYEAALMATAKISQQSLLNYL